MHVRDRMPYARIARLALAGMAAAGMLSAQVNLTGRVVDQNDAPVSGATVTAHLPEQRPVTGETGPSGAFRLSLPSPGRYLVSVNRAGYFRLTDSPADVPPSGLEMTLVINIQSEVFQSVTVGDMPSPVDPHETQREERLSGTEINDIPFPNGHSLRNAMRLMPGVIQDPTGGVHFHGGSEDQTRYTLNGFDVNSPIDNRYTTRMAVEGVRSMELVSTREAPQYGRGSAGTLQIQTENGTDRWRATATNFVPGVDSQHGLRIGNWTPRAGFSGPLVKGRAWFSDTFNGQYNSGYLSGLPKGQDTNTAWTAGNLLHTQINLTPADIFYADVMTNFDHQAHYGLGVLDPISTTTGLSRSEWLAGAKISHAWYGGAVLEGGASWHRVYRRRVPEGTDPYVVSPDGRTGNYFLDSREDGRRQQAFLNYFPRVIRRFGTHQLLIGADTERTTYSAGMHRTQYQVLGLSGLPAFLTTFSGSGVFGLGDVAMSTHVNDHWQILENLTVDIGIRQEWNALAPNAALAPRLSAAWVPFPAFHMKFTGGYARVHDTVSLSQFSRPFDQQAITVPYNDDGTPLAPLTTVFIRGQGLQLPVSDRWSLGVEKQFSHTISSSVEWLRRRGRDGFVYAPLASAVRSGVSLQPLALSYGFGGTYELQNLRRDSYDEVALTARQTFGEQYGWMASYVRSRAVTNSVLDVNIDQPIQVADNYGPVPWDTPHRFLGWTYFPLFIKNWAFASMVEWRSGFPFSIVSGEGTVVGGVNSLRYPDTFDLNLSIERRFTLRGRRLAIRLGANNITGHRNPTAVNNTLGSPNFLHFYGDEGRHMVIRLRMFGGAS